MQMLGTGPRKALDCRERIQRILEQIIKERLESMDRGDDGEQAAGHEGILGVLLRLQKEGGTPIPLKSHQQKHSRNHACKSIDLIRFSPSSVTLLGHVWSGQRYLVGDAELGHDGAHPVPGGDDEAFKGTITITRPTSSGSTISSW